LDRSWYLQGNVVASPLAQEYNITWVKSWKDMHTPGSTGLGYGNGRGFVDELQTGDVIGIWARAKVSAA